MDRLPCEPLIQNWCQPRYQPPSVNPSPANCTLSALHSTWHGFSFKKTVIIETCLFQKCFLLLQQTVPVASQSNAEIIMFTARTRKTQKRIGTKCVKWLTWCSWWIYMKWFVFHLTFLGGICIHVLPFYDIWCWTLLLWRLWHCLCWCISEQRISTSVHTEFICIELANRNAAIKVNAVNLCVCMALK